MKISNVVHKGLRRLVENDDAIGLQHAVVEKVRRIVTFLQDIESEEEIRTVPSWKAHLLTGDRKGTWSPQSAPSSGRCASAVIRPCCDLQDDHSVIELFGVF